MLAFIEAHAFAISVSLAAIVALGRAVKARFGAQLAARFPRLAHAAAAVAALSPDVVAFLVAVYRAWTGKPLPVVIAGGALSNEEIAASAKPRIVPPPLPVILALALVGCAGMSQSQRDTLTRAGVQIGAKVASEGIALLFDAIRTATGVKAPTVADDGHTPLPLTGLLLSSGAP